jgi:Spy/CpxP family protein refolding chaperone
MAFRRVVLVLATAAWMAAPGLTLASPMDGGWHHQSLELLRGVNLTDAQKQQIRSIEQADKTQIKTAAQQLHALHDQLASAMLSGATLEQLTAIQLREDTLRAQIAAQMLTTAVQVRGVLTADQLSAASAQHAKLAALHDQERAVEHQEDAQ